jgi:nucleoside-diphosphate-sugar epimerase
MILVTGGTGFVAGWCIAELLKRGQIVRATVRSSAKEPAVRAVAAAAGAASDRLELAVADLTRDDGWDAALAGCEGVLHVASPLATESARDPDALVAPARDGTLRVLRAAAKSGVRRVVLTSAAAAARAPEGSGAVADETMWTDPDRFARDPYRRSKVLAERAAWDFAAAHAGLELATILPGAVFGPVLSQETQGSVQVIARLLRGVPPRLPRLGFWIVDVRDLADLHIRALTAPEAAGQRFLATGEFMWLADLARTLRAELGERAAKVATRALPDLAVRLLALVQPQLRALTPLLGAVNPVSSDKARRLLGFAPRPARTTVVDCAKSLLA